MCLREIAKLYGQKCDLLYRQNLYEQAVETEKEVYKYATLASDTVLRIDSRWGMLAKCYALCDYKTVADESWNALEESCRLGMFGYASGQLCTSVLACIELGRYDDAGRFLEIYEQYSGDVDSVSHVSNFPIYYYAKGRLLTVLGQLDLAEKYFRRELQEKDWNNRQAAYRGLHAVFEQAGRLDSAYKYAVLQCDAVDSAYQEKVTASLQNLHEMYDYSRAQKDSFQKTLQLEEKQRRMQVLWLVLGLVIVAVLFILYFFYSYYERRIATAVLELERSNAGLAEVENLLDLLKEKLCHTEDEGERAKLAEQVKQTEDEAKRQEEEVEAREEKLRRIRNLAQSRARSVRIQYQGCELFHILSKKVRDRKIATDEDYELIEKLLLQDDTRLLFRFYKTVPNVSETEKRVFLLFRLGMRKSDASVLMAHERTASAKACDRMFERSMGRMPATRAEAYNWLLEI